MQSAECKLELCTSVQGTRGFILQLFFSFKIVVSGVPTEAGESTPAVLVLRSAIAALTVQHACTTVCFAVLGVLAAAATTGNAEAGVMIKATGNRIQLVVQQLTGCRFFFLFKVCR